MKWFNRKFNFTDLEGTLPSILERLQGTPLRLQHKISAIPQHLLDQTPDQLWTIKQQVGHLGDLEPLWEQRFKDFLKNQPVLTEADLSNTKTHQADHNQREIQELLTRFSSRRNHLCKIVKSLELKAEVWTSNHPRLGTPMRPIDLAYFVAEHDDHHLAAITALFAKLKS